VATCTFADDAFLVAAFPGVVQTTAERWAVAVLAAQAGTYSVTMQGAQFPYEAAADDDVGAIRDGLLAVLGAQMLAAVAPSGADAVVLQEGAAGPLALTVAGPADDTIEATLIAGGDGNAAGRAFWLERAKCWLPPCCYFVHCTGDYTLMHAALAAFYVDKFAGGSSTGTASMGAFKSMRLGPVSLEAVAKAWATANPADADLADNGPGSLYLAIRARYVFGVRCA
jgi:hypothetical protein